MVEISPAERLPTARGGMALVNAVREDSSPQTWKTSSARAGDRMKGLVPARSARPEGDHPWASRSWSGVWASTGFYKVQPDEQGVELMFGKFRQIDRTRPALLVPPVRSAMW